MAHKSEFENISELSNYSIVNNMILNDDSTTSI